MGVVEDDFEGGSEDEDYNEEDEEYDEEGGENEEGGVDTRKKRARSSQFVDDAAEEDEDEEEEDGDFQKRGKKAKSKSSMFIDDAAAVASDDEDEEEGEEEFIQDEDLGELPAETERPQRHRPLHWSAEEEDADIERFVERIEQRSQAMSADYDESETTDVEQQALLPSVRDPKLWMVKCQLGHEREAVATLMQKFLNKEAAGERLLIKSAVALDHLKGFIYVESDKEAYVKQACNGLRLIYSYQIKLVPIKEMTEVLTVTNKAADLEMNTWVRVKMGLYKGDLGQVVDVDNVRQLVTVKLVPRVDWKAVQAKQSGDASFTKKGSRPPARFYSREDVEHHRLRIVTRRDNSADFFDFVDNMKFSQDGYFYKVFSLKTLSTRGVTPTLDEIQRFRKDSDSAETSVGLLAPDSASRPGSRVQKGDLVQVVEGDLKGLKGKVDKILDDEVIILPLDKDIKDSLPMKEHELRKYFAVGDHVKVTVGEHSGATGLIINVEDQVVSILTDSAREEVRVFSRDVMRSSETHTGPSQLGEFELHDLVLISATSYGVIVKVDEAGCEVLLNETDRPVLQTVKLKELKRKIMDRRAFYSDKSGNSVAINDVVRVLEGKYKGRQGTVQHLHKGVLFLLDRTLMENFGFCVVRSRSCQALGGRQSGTGRQTERGGLPFPHESPRQRGPFMSPQSPGRGMQRGFQGRGRGRDDSLTGRSMKIASGPFKGYRGRVIGATDSTVRMELESQMKIVTVRRDQLPNSEAGQDTPLPRETPRDTGRYGYASETPMRQGARTPQYSGGFRDTLATPMRDPTRTPMRAAQGNATPSRGDAWDTMDPSPWKSSGSLGTASSFQGLTPAFSPADAASRQPNTPGVPGQRGAFEAPTPGGGALWATAGTPQLPNTPGTGVAYAGVGSPFIPSLSTPGTAGTGSLLSPLPMTPGALAATPGEVVPSGTPNFSQAATPSNPPVAAALLTDVVVSFRSGPQEGQKGVIREIMPDESYRVFLGAKGDGRPVVSSDMEVEVVAPKKNDRIKILAGEFKGRTGKLIQLDAVDAIAKLDGDDGSMKAFELADLGKLEL